MRSIAAPSQTSLARLVPWVVVLLIATSKLAHSDDLEFFETHVRPLLVSRCYSCHSDKANKSEGGLRLDSRRGWQQGGDSGPAIVPGKAEQSLLIRAVRSTDGDLQMPPDAPLSKSAIETLERWVQMGAPDPRHGPSPSHRGNDPADPIAGRDHWAYRPLIESPPAAVNQQGWTRGTIDTFVLATLERNDLKPSPDADRRTLARRVYLQLTGLPPTPSQMAAFLSDDRPNAFTILVDQLLQSPSFGERWGRHWLDLARYADSNGLDENFLFREAWRYRNGVIESFNRDQPLDRFLLEQIAGDLLPYDSIAQRDRQRIAAGFLVVGPKVLLGNDPQQRRMDVADEQLDTIGRAVLAQTLGCARCHDHKFDPVPTTDYYALAGIFTSTEVMETRHMLGSQRMMERLEGLGENGHVADDEYEKYWRERPNLQKQHKQAVAALEFLKHEDSKGWTEHAGKHADSIADVARDESLPRERRIEAQQELIHQLSTAIAQLIAIPPRAMIPRDAGEPKDEHVRIAGQFDRKGDKVARGFLRVLGGDDHSISAQQSGRVELAQWLMDTENGAGHLSARVLANRIWYHLIGRGIVRTVDNFGRTGETPSHPELLDYLAKSLVRSGWSTKALVREIVLSRTFAMSSRHDRNTHDLDPENRLLWRMHRRRLDAESVRDSMRLAAGTLDLTPRDSSVWYLGDQATAVGANKNRRRTDFPCRSIYLPVIRNDLPELFGAFDFADPHRTTGMRPDTTVATQSLFILNDPSVAAAAKATAQRLMNEPTAEARIDRMFRLIIGTPPGEHDVHEILRFIADSKQQLGSTEDADLRVWAMACRAMFASSRFLVVE